MNPSSPKLHSSKKNKDYSSDTWNDKITNIFKTLDAMIFILDERDQFIDVFCTPNSPVYEYRDILRGKSHHDVLPPHLHEQYQIAAQAVRSTGELQEYDFYIRINQEKRWFRNQLSLYPDGHTLIALIKEIQSKSSAKDYIQGKEDQFQQLISNIGLGFIRLDTQGNVLFTNDEYLNLIGFRDNREIQGRNIIEWIDKRDIEKNQQAIKTTLTQGMIKNLEIRYTHIDGSTIPIEVNATYLPQANPPQIIAFCTDITSRKQTEQKLTQSNDRYRNLVENDLIGFFTVDLEHKITFANELFAKSLQYQTKDLIGLSMSKLMTTQEFQRILAFRAKRRELGKGDTYSTHFFRKDGQLTPVLIHASPLFDTKKNLIGSMAISLDQSGRFEIENQLQESEARYRSFIDTQLVGVNLSDLEENITFTNQAFADMIGYSQAELLEMNLKDLTVASEFPKYQQETLNRKQGLSNIYDTQLVRKNGEIIDVKVYAAPYRNSQEEVVGTLGVIQDITEQKQIQQELKESEQKYRSLINNMSDSVVIHNEQGQFLEVNPATCKMYGYSREEFLQMGIKDIEDPDYHQNFDENVFKTEHFEHGFRFTTRGLTKHGRKIIVDVESRPIEYKNQTAIMSISRDITMEQKLEQERLQIDKLSSLGILAGGIAHDFNNFLMAISGNLQLAQLDPDNQDKYLQSMGGAIDRATQLAQKLLTFSKGGSPVKETASLKEIVQETTQFMLEGSKVLPQYHIEPDLWNVEVDSGQISQVVQNLIENAKQAMPTGGKIDITLENIEIFASSSLPLEQGKYVKVIIEDEGIGIAQHHLPLIFDPYFTTKEKGHGLGLAICYSIISKHNGYITATSKKDEGTTFYFYLPASEVAQPQFTVSKKQTVGSKHGETILVMDDDAAVRETLRLILEKYNYKFLEAKDGDECLKLYQTAAHTENPVDLVIMDLTIPGGKGGEETIEALLKLDPYVKCIVSSGYSTDPVMSSPQEYGFKAAIAKPYSFTNLLKLLRSVLD